MPERSQHKTPSFSELTSALDEVNRQLEIADENENQIERFLIRDRLLEKQDSLHTLIDELTDHSSNT